MKFLGAKPLNSWGIDWVDLAAPERGDDGGHGVGRGRLTAVTDSGPLIHLIEIAPNLSRLSWNWMIL